MRVAIQSSLNERSLTDPCFPLLFSILLHLSSFFPFWKSLLHSNSMYMVMTTLRCTAEHLDLSIYLFI